MFKLYIKILNDKVVTVNRSDRIQNPYTDQRWDTREEEK